MEGFFVVIGLALLTLPVLAVVALLRTLSLRRDLDTQREEQAIAARDLRIEVATLKRSLGETQSELARVKSTLQDRVVSAPPAPVTAAHEAPKPAAASPAPAPAAPPEPARAEHSIPAPVAAKTIAPAPAPPTPATSQPAPAQPAAPRPAPSPVSPAPAVATPPAPHTAPAPRPQPPAAPPLPPIPPRPVEYTPAAPPRPSLLSRLGQNLPLEAFLGMNLFAKIGIVLLVLGFALLGRMALVAMGPAGKVALLYAIGGAMLGGGIWTERNERYKLIGRTGIGGGWALLFFTTYAMQHVEAMQVMQSATLNCVLLLAVAVATVVHTLRYDSQLVTGLAFLLGFSTVALTQDTVYALTAGVILALGIVFVALKKRWYELEIFGILASFGNHLYWLVRLYPEGVAGHTFAQFWPSTIILLLYWLTFRISYIVRKVDSAGGSKGEERSSTAAGLLNTTLLLVVMKFQSTRPELAFYALAALGALEFAFGQLPITRRRRPAFALLTIMGTMLVFAAVPFKYSGNSIALVWMIAAEALLLAGIVQKELLFRRLGLIAGVLTGGLVACESAALIEERLTGGLLHFTASGVELLVCAALFYANALFLRARWRSLFTGLDDKLATLQGYLGMGMAVLGLWALATQDWTAVAWAALLVVTAAGVRRLRDIHLTAQVAVLALITALSAAVWNFHSTEGYPHHVTLRLVTLPLLALAYYLTAWLIADASTPRRGLQSWTLVGGSAVLFLLAWLEIAPAWVALGWLALALALAACGRRLRIPDLCWQEHALAIAITARVALVNLGASSTLECYLPTLLVATAFYAVSRRCTLADAAHRRPAAWLHTFAATGLLAGLAWHRADQPWLAVLWAAFALALAVFDRFLPVEELPLQTHLLSLLALGQAAAANLWLQQSWHGVSLQVVTLGLLAVLFYTLTYVVRMRESDRALGLQHLYSCAATALVAWPLWQQLAPMAVVDGFALFAALLFAAGEWRRESPLRLQSYALLVIAYGRLFGYNLLHTAAPWHGVSQRVLSVVPVAVVSLGVYAWLETHNQDEPESSWAESSWVGGLMAWLSTAAVAGLLYVELQPAWIVVAWAALAVLGLGLTLLLGRTLFLRQAALLVVLTVMQGIGENIYGAAPATTFWQDRFTTLTVACLILLAALPLALRLHARFRETQLAEPDRLLRLDRIEQWVFFAPVLLVTLGIFQRMGAGVITLSWGIEGLAAVLLGLAVAQRSFRITGLVLLLLCVAKIVFHDAWQLGERDRYITFIALGGALMLVSFLYNRYRESVLKLL